MLKAMEPFKIKSFQSVSLLPRETREALLKAANYNIFNLESQHVYIDLLTDSGTGAQSLDQWASMTNPGFSNPESSCIQELKKTIRNITGFEHVFPAHQGRAAEYLFCKHILKKGDIVISNSLFDTTRAHIEATGATGIDLPDNNSLFTGDINLIEFDELLNRYKQNIRLVIITCTNNTYGGAPVSMGNIKRISSICRQKNILILTDACRFAENIYFVKTMDKQYASSSLQDIAQEMFSYFDGAFMSLKKDGLSNMGGIFATSKDSLADLIEDDVLAKGSLHTFGGITAEDARACTVGLNEVMDERYLQYRLQQTKLLGEALLKRNVPILQPVGGHAIYVEAGKILSHLSSSQYPALALTCSAYVEGGVRCIAYNNVMSSLLPDGTRDTRPQEYVRLCVPNRTYTINQLLYVAEIFDDLAKRANLISGMRMVKTSNVLRHLMAEFEPENDELIAEK